MAHQLAQSIDDWYTPFELDLVIGSKNYTKSYDEFYFVIIMYL